MTKSRRQVTWPKTFIVLGVCGLSWGFAARCGAAPYIASPGAKTSDRADGEGLTTPGGAAIIDGGGNYDYFTAHLRGDLQSYLALVTLRHVSEHTWAIYWSGNYVEPLGDCEYALARFPNHPRALHLLTEIAKATNQVSMPIPYFEHALQLYPQYAFTHAQYGHYLIEIGAIPAGVEQLREALRIEPGQFQAKAWLAQALESHPELGKEPPAGGSGANAAAPGAGKPKGSR
jgi:tetratricopeptide (TPR) repeat protein